MYISRAAREKLPNSTIFVKYLSCRRNIEVHEAALFGKSATTVANAGSKSNFGLHVEYFAVPAFSRQTRSIWHQLAFGDVQTSITQDYLFRVEGQGSHIRPQLRLLLASFDKR